MARWPGPLLGRACAVALAGLLLLAAMAAGARLAWFLELATHFRPQYAAACAVLAVACLALGRRWLALVAVALGALNASVAAPYLLPYLGGVPAVAAAQGGTHIVSLNLFYRNARYAEVRDYLLRADPDVVVLSELTPAWVRELQPVTERYPHWMSVGRRSPWGLGVYSRHPLRGARWTNLGVRGSSNVVARVEAPAGAFDLVAVHLASPTSSDRARFRDRQLRELAQLLGPPRAAGPPRLLVGDLNITPFSPLFGDLLDATGLVDARRPRGLLGTWHARFPLLQIQIDHCLADAAAGVASVTRGPAVGSDHYPLEIRLRGPG